MTDEIKSIRKYFKPIQPSIKLGEKYISYKEFSPSIELENYIYCYWQLKTNKRLDKKYKYRVVSDGCIDIFLEAQNTEQSFIMGFCNKYSEFELEKDFNYIGIRFLPSFFPVLFRADAKLLSNKFQRLTEVNSQLAVWIKNIDRNSNFVELFNQKFESIIKNISFTKLDNRFYEAVTIILRKSGNVDLDKDVVAGLSSRQLRRIFNYYVGTTPKAFANVVRFQHILNAKPSQQSLKKNKIYFDVGFYDQAHFIKNFKTFYGITPSKAFN